MVNNNKQHDNKCVKVGECGFYGDILYKVQRVNYRPPTAFVMTSPCSRCIFNKADCNPKVAPIPCAAHTREDGESVKFLRAEHK